ncbi:MAG: TolB family protein, partial [Bacteroidota bacterium]
MNRSHCFNLRSRILMTGMLLMVAYGSLKAQRVPVLSQIDLPHGYYFRELYLPQLTAGPSSVDWLPDGSGIIFSMGGSLWRHAMGSVVAEQLTDGDGYDYQPDVSPDGKQVIFTRYTGQAMELQLLDLATRQTTPLTTD